MITGRCARGQQRRGPRQLVGVGLLRGDGGRGPDCGVGLVEDDLQRDVDEHRPAVRGERGGRPPGGSTAGVSAVRHDGLGVLGDRAHQRQVVDLLQAARAPPELRRPAADHDHRRAVEVARWSCRRCRW